MNEPQEENHGGKRAETAGYFNAENQPQKRDRRKILTLKILTTVGGYFNYGRRSLVGC